MQELAPLAPITTESDSDDWLSALRSSGPAYDQAVEALYALVLRAARFEVGRRRAAVAYVRGEELDDLATQAAADATMAILAKLDDFRGASRFTTWAYKFAVLEAGTKVRRRAWQHREVTLDSESWTRLADRTVGPDIDAEQAELLQATADGIGGDLTPHQREILLSLAIDGVPIDVLAERLDTTRGALYKTLHDARPKLRATLTARGFPVEATT